MPKIPVSQHQKTAPGPPREIAVATPIILPVPMVAAKEVASAWNWLTSPEELWSFFTESAIDLKMRICGNRNLTVKKMWVPRRRIIIGHPHNIEEISEIICAIFSIDF